MITPLSQDLDWAGQRFVTAEQPTPPAGQIPDANYVIAGPDYFRTLQIPLRSGRAFDEYDTQSSEQVVIVNEELARLHWQGQIALGLCLLCSGAAGDHSVVRMEGAECCGF